MGCTGPLIYQEVPSEELRRGGGGRLETRIRLNQVPLWWCQFGAMTMMIMGGLLKAVLNWGLSFGP